MPTTPTAPAALSTDPLGPFGVTVDGVLALIPEATVWPTRADVPPGARGITREDVADWIDECSASVAVVLDGWEHARNTTPDGVTITTTTNPDGSTTTVVNGTPAPTVNGAPVYPGTDLDQLRTFARTVAKNRAASYAEAARHPERAAKADTSYADVLWRRYELGLADLVAWWKAHRPTTAGTDPATGTPTGHASAMFPPPMYADDMTW